MPLQGADILVQNVSRSYLVNTAGCNDCHTSDPSVQYTAAGNSYLGQHIAVNPASYGEERRLKEFMYL